MIKNKDIIIQYAKAYNNKEFIDSDPIRFPHKYKKKKDIEISAFISSWLAYGNRKTIITTLEKLDQEYQSSPSQYLEHREYKKYKNSSKTLYRFYKENDYYLLMDRLREIYYKEGYPDLESKLNNNHNPNHGQKAILESLISVFPNLKGIPKNTLSACKKVNMFLRWMTRNDGIVDLGIWNSFSPSQLIIPLDTHSFRIAKQLELTSKNTANMVAAIEVSNKLSKIFPNDPCLGDFALFGYGVNNKRD